MGENRKRIHAAAEADFVIALYNPSSRKRSGYLQKVCDMMLEHKAEGHRLRFVGISEERRECRSAYTERAPGHAGGYVYYRLYRQFPDKISADTW